MKRGITFGEVVKLYLSLGATAIEINWGLKDYKKFIELELSDETIKDIKKFKYISVHAPKVLNDEVIEKLKYFCDKLPVDGIVVHPDVIEDFDKLEKLDLPILFENMDINKKMGIMPKEFKKLKKKHKFGFVLDLQHVYEHDPTMKLTDDFIKVMGNRLKHMHVSGCTKEKHHISIHLSENKEAITKILKLGIDVPKIAEGPVFGDIEKTVKNEIEYIKSFEKD